MFLFRKAAVFGLLVGLIALTIACKKTNIEQSVLEPYPEISSKRALTNEHQLISLIERASKEEGFVSIFEGKEYEGVIRVSELLEFLNSQSNAPVRLSGQFETTRIYFPFYAEHETVDKPKYAFVNRLSVEEKVDVFAAERGNQLVFSNVLDKRHYPEYALFFIVDIEDEDDVAGIAVPPWLTWLPWHRCYCSRGGADHGGGADTTGACLLHSKGGSCGPCDRADFGGDCSGSTCPGC